MGRWGGVTQSAPYKKGCSAQRSGYPTVNRACNSTINSKLSPKWGHDTPQSRHHTLDQHMQRPRISSIQALHALCNNTSLRLPTLHRALFSHFCAPMFQAVRQYTESMYSTPLRYLPWLLGIARARRTPQPGVDSLYVSFPTPSSRLAEYSSMLAFWN